METAWIADSTRILQAFGWTLIHSLWQAAIVYALLSILLKAVPAMPAKIRYACTTLALAAITVWTWHTLVRHWPEALGTAGAVQTATYHADMRLPVMREVDEIMPWLMMAYGLGLGLMLGRLMIGFGELRRLRNSGIELGGELGEQLQRLARHMGVRQTVRLRQTPAVAVPMVLGMLRPVILLPPTCIESLSPAALEAVLLHELAHIRRADFLVNVLQSVVEAILFFNPFVRRISAILRREREHSCDDLVVRHSVHPLEYAAALASLAAGGRQPAFALAASDGRYPLLNRIKRITTMEKKSVRPGTVIIVSGVAALLIAISIICFTPAFAQQKSKTASASSHPAPPPPPVPGAAVMPPANLRQPPAPPAPLAPAAPAPSLGAAPDDVIAKLPTMGETIGAATADALKQVDWDEVRREMQQASKEIESIDWKAIENETRNGLAQARREIDRAQLGKAINDAMAQVERAMAELPEPPEVPQPAARDDRKWQADQRRQAADERRAEADQRRAAADELRARADERRAEAGVSRSKASNQRAAASERLAEARAEMEEARRELDKARQEMEAARKELEQARQERKD